VSGTAPLRLELRRGPLEAAALEAIARTYGTVDPRYANAAFADTIFNRNPYGFSWHALAWEGERVVGHYAVIPMRARGGGASFLSGKGEALFLEESCRARTARVGDLEAPAGIALMNALHAHALADGAAVLHNITSAEIGMIQRMDGFRVARSRRPQAHFLVAPGALRQLNERPAQAALARALAAVQRGALAAARARVAAGGPRAIACGTGDDAAALATFSRTPPPAEGWSIDRDGATLRWLRAMDRLAVVRLAERPDAFVIANTGRARELLHASLPPDAPGAALALLTRLVADAVRGRAWTFSVPAASDAGRALGAAARVLCFRARTLEQLVYVKAAPGFPLRPEALAYDRLFNL